MKAQLIKYQRTLDQLPTTTKSLVLLAVLVVIFILWQQTLWQNLRLSMAIADNKILVTKFTINALKTSLDIMQKELEAKKAALNNTGSLAPDTTGTLIAANKTSTALHDILIANNKLVLLQLKNLAPKEVMLPQVNTKIFAHEIIIKFLGDYFSTMDYLQAIEKLKWKIFWDKIEYKVTKYPMAEITLHIHTLNTTDEIINV